MATDAGTDGSSPFIDIFSSLKQPTSRRAYKALKAFLSQTDIEGAPDPPPGEIFQITRCLIHDGRRTDKQLLASKNLPKYATQQDVDDLVALQGGCRNTLPYHCSRRLQEPRHNRTGR